MSFIEQIKERARQEIKTIVLPEAEDLRILEAARNSFRRKICWNCFSRKWKINKRKSKNKSNKYTGC